MSFIVDDKRIATMRKKIGANADILVANKNYLPMFVNRHDAYPEEFKKSVEVAKTKQSPRAFFASMWSPKNVTKTLTIMRKMLARAVSALAELREQKRKGERFKQVNENKNVDGLARLADLKAKFLEAHYLRS